MTHKLIQAAMDDLRQRARSLPLLEPVIRDAEMCTIAWRTATPDYPIHLPQDGRLTVYIFQDPPHIMASFTHATKCALMNLGWHVDEVFSSESGVSMRHPKYEECQIILMASTSWKHFLDEGRRLRDAQTSMPTV